MNEITYNLVGDYYLPNLVLTDPPDATPLGKYGTDAQRDASIAPDYLRSEKPALYSMLLLTERLYPLCREIDEAAPNRLATILDKIAAHEIVLTELVYC